MSASVIFVSEMKSTLVAMLYFFILSFYLFIPTYTLKKYSNTLVALASRTGLVGSVRLALRIPPKYFSTLFEVMYIKKQQNKNRKSSKPGSLPSISQHCSKSFTYRQNIHKTKENSNKNSLGSTPSIYQPCSNQ